MKQVLLALCISCLVMLPGEGSLAEEAGVPATQRVKKSTKALEPQPLREEVQAETDSESTPEAPKVPREATKGAPSAQRAPGDTTTVKPGSKVTRGTAPAVTEWGAERPKRSVEQEASITRRKEMERERWVPKTHRASPGKEGGESLFSVQEAEEAGRRRDATLGKIRKRTEADKALFSVEEAERVQREQPSIHKMVTEEKEGEALFSVEEAERAQREQPSTQEMVSGKKKKADLFSVEEAERAVKRPAVSTRKRVKKPSRAEREVRKSDRKARRKALITRHLEKEKEKEKWVKIEFGFAYRNVEIHQGSYTFETHFIGEMANNTGRNYGIVKFMFSTYDRQGKLISEEPFQITDFYDGQIKTFTGTVVDGFKDIASYKIRFISAAPTARG